MNVCLSLGSNEGDRLANLTAARNRIAALPGCRIAAASPVYETEPVDVTEEHRDKWFLNAALIVQTGLPLRELQEELHTVEAALGRVRVEDRNAPRTLDIDIICTDGPPLSSTVLTVPHPRWKERRFVVEPLAAIRPDWDIPGEARTPAEVLAALPPKPVATLFTEDW